MAMRFWLPVVAMLLADAVMFDGRYRADLWQEAKQVGYRVNLHIGYHLRRAGLGG
jgi:hypothetical protein